MLHVSRHDINRTDLHGPLTRPGKNPLDISDINGA